ncbi:MAG: hypothetical protein CMJ18_08165 [Phycisphaeraceae bacterium]|nr:hypothetical protein [Phycisphaeraceae bacterium]
MMRQRLLGTGLLMTAASALGLVTGEAFYPILVCGVGIVGAIGPLQLNLGPAGRILVMLLLGLLIAAKSIFGVIVDAVDFLGGVDPLLAGAVEYFLTLMALSLYQRTAAGITPAILVMGLVSLTLLAPSARNEAVFPFHAMMLGYLVLAAAFAATGVGRPAEQAVPPGRHRFAVAWLLIISVGLGWGGTLVADRVPRAPGGRPVGHGGVMVTRSPGVRSAQTLFPEAIGLHAVGAWRRVGPEKTVLRAWSKTPPGYLRARAYHQYADGTWRTTDRRRRCSKLPTVGGRLSGDTCFVVAGNGGKSWRSTEISMVGPVRGAILSSLGTGRVRAPVAALWVDQEDCVYVPRLGSRDRYVVDVPRGDVVARLPRGRSGRYLDLPQAVSTRLGTLAGQLFAETDPCDARIRSVVDHFRTRFAYAFGASTPDGEDPVVHFALQGDEGHCELFASAATILLRLGGVPSRYVVGYVAHERSRDGAHWIARRSDAHAWCEAWDIDRQRWITVEATPATGVPTARDSFPSVMAEDRLNQGFPGASGSAAATKRGLASKVCGLLGFKPAWFGMLLGAGVVFFAWRRKRGRRRRGCSSRDALQDLLATMDRRLRPEGLARARSETLHAFSARVEADSPGDWGPAAAEWYRTYGFVRYAGRAVSGDVRRLALLMERVTAPLRGATSAGRD